MSSGTQSIQEKRHELAGLACFVGKHEVTHLQDVVVLEELKPLDLEVAQERENSLLVHQEGLVVCSNTAFLGHLGVPLEHLPDEVEFLLDPVDVPPLLEVSLLA